MIIQNLVGRNNVSISLKPQFYCIKMEFEGFKLHGRDMISADTFCLNNLLVRLCHQNMHSALQSNSNMYSSSNLKYMQHKSLFYIRDFIQ